MTRRSSQRGAVAVGGAPTRRLSRSTSTQQVLFARSRRRRKNLVEKNTANTLDPRQAQSKSRLELDGAAPCVAVASACRRGSTDGLVVAPLCRPLSVSGLQSVVGRRNVQGPKHDPGAATAWGAAPSADPAGGLARAV
jgi:hypothetical protein